MNDDAELFLRAERLRERGRPAEAEALYREILGRRPRLLAARRALAELLTSQGWEDEAAAALEAARPLEAETLADVAHAALVAGRYDAAIDCSERALALQPDMPEALVTLGKAWCARGRTKKALSLYRRCLELDPGNPQAAHLAAALGDGPKPERASDGYVKALFARSAGDFDRSLLDALEYRGPELLFDAVSDVLPETASALDILDLGCGTGLAGVRFRPLARRLEGVDLSPEMIEHARRRGIYDAVSVAELTAALGATDRTFDLLIAADVFVYIGDLEPVMAAAAGALRRGGLLAFTVEWQHRRAYTLRGSGDYTPSPAYVRQCGKAAGFVEASGGVDRLRLRRGKPVKGYVSVMRKAWPGAPRRGKHDTVISNGRPGCRGP